MSKLAKLSRTLHQNSFASRRVITIHSSRFFAPMPPGRGRSSQSIDEEMQKRIKQKAEIDDTEATSFSEGSSFIKFIAFGIVSAFSIYYVFERMNKYAK